jgi:hypothetical protein
MPSESVNLPEQEQSIKARAGELYVEPQRPTVNKPAKPFLVYLRETPAVPFSAPTKVTLWVVGGIVALLFLAALWRVSLRRGLKPSIPESQPTETTSMRQLPKSRTSLAMLAAFGYPMLATAMPGKTSGMAH